MKMRLGDFDFDENDDVLEYVEPDDLYEVTAQDVIELYNKLDDDDKRSVYSDIKFLDIDTLTPFYVLDKMKLDVILQNYKRFELNEIESFFDKK